MVFTKGNSIGKETRFKRGYIHPQEELDKIRTKELQDKGFRVIRLWENEIKSINLESFMEILQ